MLRPSRPKRIDRYSLYVFLASPRGISFPTCRLAAPSRMTPVAFASLGSDTPRRRSSGDVIRSPKTGAG